MTVTEEVWAADIILHDNNRLIEGRDSLRELILAQRSAIPDYNVTIESLIGERDYIAMRYTLRGTFKNKLFDIPPTGKEIKYVAHDLAQFKEGKLVEVWESWLDLT